MYTHVYMYCIILIFGSESFDEFDKVLLICQNLLHFLENGTITQHTYK